MAYYIASGRARLSRWLLLLWHGRIARQRYKPLMRAEFAEGDLFNQAVFLMRAGYREAAVVMARVAVERYLRRLALVLPEWKKCPRSKGPEGVSGLTYYLFRAEVIDDEFRRRLNQFAKNASRIAHGHDVAYAKARTLIEQSEAIKPRLEACMRKALAG